MVDQFTSQQLSIINGSLLGDGHLSKPKYGNSAFGKSQCGRRREYLEWMTPIFGELFCYSDEYDNRCKGKTYRKAVWSTKAFPAFTELRKKWYPDGKKIVPRDLKLDPLAIAIWFFDDGSNYLNKRTAKFATYCFSKDDCNFLCSLLAEFNINCWVSNENVTVVYADSYKTLIDLVKPYMLWPFFEHKIRYRDPVCTATTLDEGRLIFDLYKNGWTMQQIADKIGKSIAPVSDVLRGNILKSLKLSEVKGNLSIKNTSGYKNVSWDKNRNKWIAHLRINGKRKYIGRFEKIEDAVAAIDVFKSANV